MELFFCFVQCVLLVIYFFFGFCRGKFSWWMSLIAGIHVLFVRSFPFFGRMTMTKDCKFYMENYTKNWRENESVMRLTVCVCESVCAHLHVHLCLLQFYPFNAHLIWTLINNGEKTHTVKTKVEKKTTTTTMTTKKTSERWLLRCRSNLFLC